MEDERQRGGRLDGPNDGASEAAPAPDDGELAYQRLLAGRVRDFASAYAFYVKRLQTMVDVFAERSLSMGEGYLAGAPSEGVPTTSREPAAQRPATTMDGPVPEATPSPGRPVAEGGGAIDESMLPELPVDGSTSGEPPEEDPFGPEPGDREPSTEVADRHVAEGTDATPVPPEAEQVEVVDRKAVGETGPTPASPGAVHTEVDDRETDDLDDDVSADDELVSLEMEAEERLIEREEAEEERLARDEERVEEDFAAAEYRDEEALLDREAVVPEGSEPSPTNGDAGDESDASISDETPLGTAESAEADGDDPQLSEFDRQLRELDRQIRELNEELGIADD